MWSFIWESLKGMLGLIIIVSMIAIMLGSMVAIVALVMAVSGWFIFLIIPAALLGAVFLGIIRYMDR
jgi:hypothetical protein